MVFSSITFLFYFLPIVLVVYYLSPDKIKNYVLLISSIVFYFIGDAKNILLMFFCIGIAYVFGMLIDKSKRHKRIFLVSSLLIIVSILIYFKYFNFIIENVNALFGMKLTLPNILLPVGISFYIFQIISYIIDVYKGNIRAQKNFFKFATYVSLFPQLIAGPIVRYETVEEALNNRKTNVSDVAYGIRRFIIGLAKKVLIADVLGQLALVTCQMVEESVLSYWLYGISSMLQIYFDFSGYSDMAIGLGKMFGFEFLENFNYPYIAKSVTDFWRRWHISLSNWFKDYVYIPLGGNRKGKLKQIRNILIVWALTGMWHGASWNFIIWGVFFAFILIIEKFLTGKLLERLPKLVGIILTNFIVMISFILFNGDNITDILDKILGLFGVNNTVLVNAESIYFLKSYLIVIIMGIIGVTPLLRNVVKKVKDSKIICFIEPVFLLAMLIICTSYIISDSFSPFLYFRF